MRQFNKSAKLAGLPPCGGILGSEPAKDKQCGKKKSHTDDKKRQESTQIRDQAMRIHRL
jgi:hypothetical protein